MGSKFRLTAIISALWYTKDEMGLRMAQWFGFAAVAGYVKTHIILDTPG